MTGNIIGEEFEKYVFDQIQQRQSDQYSGFETHRTPEQIQYLNNKTAWVKLASSVEIIKEEKSGFNGLSRLEEIFNDPGLAQQYRGQLLAEKTVLFNGISALNNKDTFSPFDTKGLGYTTRKGYNKTKSIWNLNSVYGLGGTDFGQQPMPGIKDVKVKSLNRGSIREANITIKAYNKLQFAIIELLYLRLGFTMMLEWGNDKYIDNKGEFKEMGSTIIEDQWFGDKKHSQFSMLNQIEETRVKYDGNYDGFFGKVSNFDWSFNSDGSYDIKIKLITLGDVIESIKADAKVNSAKVGYLKELVDNKKDEIGDGYEPPNFVKSALQNSISKHLFEEIKFRTENNDFNEDYIDIVRTILSTSSDGLPFSRDQFKDFVNDGLNGFFSQDDDDDFEHTKNFQEFRYYIRFEEFLNIFVNKIIPLIEYEPGKSSPIIDVERNLESNCIPYYPNQISLNPKICVFAPVLKNIYSNEAYKIENLETPSYLRVLKPYVALRGNNIPVGQIMNIYLNVHFINKCLEGADSKSGISVYKFFEKVCNGLNESLGGLNNIEPILKKDRIITFIDQNPIPGFEGVYNTLPKKDIVDLEVYGYNTEKKQSNFLKDISFKTTISPQLSSMITIGATAGGSSTKEDGTAFSYWNQGLRDRFTLKIKDPSENTNPQQSKTEKEKQERYSGYASEYNEHSVYKFVTFDDTTPSPLYKYFNIGGSKDTNQRRKMNYKGDSYGRVSIREYIEIREQEYQTSLQSESVLTSDELTNYKQNNYAFYLIEAFGGKSGIKVRKSRRVARATDFIPLTSAVSLLFFPKYEFYEEELPPIPINESLYMQYDDDFIRRGQSAYKAYINSMMTEIYDNTLNKDGERNPSTTIGFIPVGFGIKLEGISGIKIYNKLNINNTFLPNNYPKALKFIIKQVDHTISNNVWETNLDTLSIPNTKPVFVIESKSDFENNTSSLYSKFKNYIKNNISSIISIPDSEIGPEPGSGFGSIFIRPSKTPTTANFLLSQMNEDARPIFKPFLEEFVSNYKGYVLKVNAIGRSYEKSVALKKQNSSNASPGRSKHNYYSGFDCNIVTPSGKTLMKADRTSWVKHGFEKLAEKHNITWGGNFSGYVDSVHFAMEFDINTAVSNAIAKHGSLDNMRGNSGKFIKLV
jgi:hypothetical protein